MRLHEKHLIKQNGRQNKMAGAFLAAFPCDFFNQSMVMHACDSRPFYRQLIFQTNRVICLDERLISALV